MIPLMISVKYDKWVFLFNVLGHIQHKGVAFAGFLTFVCMCIPHTSRGSSEGLKTLQVAFRHKHTYITSDDPEIKRKLVHSDKVQFGWFVQTRSTSFNGLKVVRTYLPAFTILQ